MYNVCCTLSSILCVTDQSKPANQTVLRKHTTLSSLFHPHEPQTQVHNPLTATNSNTRLWGRSRRESASGAMGKVDMVGGWKDASLGQVRGPPAAPPTTYHSSVATSARRVIHGRTDWSAK